MAEAVGERGYTETTVRDVLERARMSRRTFYELFDNREECFLAAYDQARSELMVSAIRTHLPGDKVRLTIDRGGDEKQITVTLDSKVG